MNTEELEALFKKPRRPRAKWDDIIASMAVGEIREFPITMRPLLYSKRASVDWRQHDGKLFVKRIA